MAPQQYAYFFCILVLMAFTPLSAPFARNLEYEYAFLLSLVFLAGIPLLACVPRLRRSFALGAVLSRRTVAREIIGMTVLAPLMVFLPGALLFLTRECRCAGGEFFTWMLVQAVPAYYLALSFYYAICFAITRHHVRPTRIVLALLLLYISATVFIAAQLYLNPQKRFVSLIFGYLHGPIYDAWLPLDEGLVLARLLSIVAALLIMSCIALRLNARRILVFALTLALFLFMAQSLTHHTSVGMGKALLDQELPDTLSAPDFVIHYHKEAGPTEVPPDMRSLFFEVQFHLGELRQYFPPVGHPVDIYVYPDMTSRKLLFGASETDVTDIHTPSIHLVRDAWNYPSLRHELVHAISSPLAYHGLGFHPNMAFTEGLAMALAPQEGPVSLDHGAAAIFLKGRAGSIRDLLGPGFYGISADRAYTLAGSFIQFLWDTYGFDKVLRIYAGASWEEVIPEDVESVMQRWRQRIVAAYDPAESILDEALYRYGGILHDICPHSKAALFKDRNYGKIVRLRQPVAWNPETDYWAWRVTLDPSDLSARIALWRKEVKKMASQRLLPRADLMALYGQVKNLAHETPQTIEDLDLALLASDILRLTGDLAESHQKLRSLAAFAASAFPGYNLLRQIQARELIEAEMPPARALAYRKYLAGWSTKPLLKFGATDKFIGKYLYLRNAESASISDDSLHRFLDLPLAPHTPPALALEWYKTLGLKLMARGSHFLAHEAFDKASSFASSGMKPILQLYQREAAFMVKNVALNQLPVR